MKNEEAKTNLKFKANAVILSALAVVGAVLIIGLAYVALRGRDTLKIKDSVYTVINGTRVTYDGVTLKHDKDGTFMVYGSNKEKSEDHVVLNEANRSITLQKSGTLNETATDAIKRVDYFTSVVMDGNGNVYLKRRGKEKHDVSGVIYDNGDTYIFLETATLEWGDNKITVYPMTVVEVSYLSYIQIYSLNEEPEFEYLENESVMATFADGKRVNLATDRFYQKDGTWRLMHLPLDVLKSWQ